jgi:hypothetical protein
MHTYLLIIAVVCLIGGIFIGRKNPNKANKLADLANKGIEAAKDEAKKI